MKKNLGLLCFTMILFGCAGMQENKTATVELAGNPTTGFTWVYTISPEGVVGEVSNEYIPDKTHTNVVGSGGKFIFVFEALAEGEAEVSFSYLRVWEEGIPPSQTVIYRAVVDNKINLTLTKK